MPTNAFLQRLNNGEDIIIAEGYLFEFERRGYLKAGGFVPEVVLEHPELVKALSREFVHAGSDVVLAFTYYGHRNKLRLIGREEDLENLNKVALRLAKEVAEETGTLFAGNICNTNTWLPDDPESQKEAELMFKEQIEWAVDAGVDFILAETFPFLGEALLALQCIQKYGKGTPVVMNITPTAWSKTLDNFPLGEACRQLEEAGAHVVGLNCTRGPATMLPAIKEVREACKGPIACLPVPYSTSEDFPAMQSFKSPFTGKQSFMLDLCAHQCPRSEIAHFALACKDLGVKLIGLCCGNSSNYLREVAEAYGRRPGASRYSPDMSQHFMYGDKERFSKIHTGLVADAYSTKESETKY